MGKDELAREFIRLRVARIKYDAENCTSWEEELGLLIEQAYGVEEMPEATLIERVAHERELLED